MDQETAYRQHLMTFLLGHAWFRSILETVRNVNPPDWLVGAGVIRSLVWDALHGDATPTLLTDVDVVFFDLTDLRPARDAEMQAHLRAVRPDVPWEATNQAAVHFWYEQTFGFAVPPLTSSADAVGTWPETATSIAVRLHADDTLAIIAPCGLHDLFGLILRRNPRRVTRAIFHQRLESKQILTKWPRVQIIDT
jgi:uncharacterized protein